MTFPILEIFSIFIILLSISLILRLIIILPILKRKDDTYTSLNFQTLQTQSQSKSTTKNQTSNVKEMEKGKIIILLGSGGHTGEMIRLLESINFKTFNKKIYLYSTGDTTSINKIIKFEKSINKNNIENYDLIQVKRARMIGQSYISTIFTTFQSILNCIKISFNHSDSDIILCNGPGTSVTICYSMFLFKVRNYKTTNNFLNCNMLTSIFLFYSL